LVTPGSDGRYVDPSAIEGLGFSVGLWNGDTRRSIGLQITCGAIVPRVSNVFTLQLPDNGQLCSWLPWPKARRLMEILVSSFEPDWATLTSHEWRPAQGAIPPQHVVGWLTYLTDVPAAALVSAGEVEQFAEGTLVTAGKACDESLGDRVQRLAASLQEMRR
jgi:hypothetical protein